jgi:acyl-CoA dehydrogenase
MITPLSGELQQIQEQVDSFFHAGKWIEDRSDLQYCRELVKEMGESALLKHLLPAPAVRSLCYLRYAISQKSAVADVLFAMQGLGSYPISLAGTEKQKEKYLQGVAHGNLIAAFAMTEPEAGSDAAAMQLRAERRGNGYVLNGKKTLISNAGLADFYTLFTRTAEGNSGITAFVLDASTKGLSVRPLEMITAHPIGDLALEECPVDESQRLGDEGEGLKIAYRTLDVFRSSVAAAAVGMAERAFQEAVRYAKERKQFGKPLAEFQAIQFKIAEMAQLLQASKLLIWDAATKKDEGAARITLESALAKSFATEAAQQIIDQALQIHGGVGLIRGSITERLYRDIRALRIYEGTTEILKSVIAQLILKED